MKKMTIKELLNFLLEQKQEMEKDIIEKYRNQKCVYANMELLKTGEKNLVKVEFICPYCKKRHVEFLEGHKRIAREYSCECGKKCFISNEYMSMPFYLYKTLKYDIDTYVLLRTKISFHFSNSDREFKNGKSYFPLDKELECRISNDRIAFFNDKNGFKILDLGTEKFLSNSKINDFITEIIDQKVYYEQYKPLYNDLKLFKEMMNKSYKWKKTKEEELEQKRIDKYKKDKYLNYELEKFEKKYNGKNLCPFHLCELSDSNSGTYLFKCFCSHCGQIFDYVTKDKGFYYSPNNVKCTHCGHFADVKSYSSQYKVTSYENSNLEENDLIIRTSYYIKNITNNFNVQTRKLKEYVVFVNNKSIKSYLINENNLLERVRITDVDDDYCSNEQKICSQDDDEIREIINNSCLKHSGYLEFIGKGETDYGHEHAVPAIDYLINYTKNNKIELLVKTKLQESIIYSYMIRADQLNKTAKNVSELLDIPNSIITLAQKAKMDYGDLQDFMNLYNCDNTINYELYKRISEKYLNPNRLMTLKTQYGISYKNIIKYLESVYNHQCIDYCDALGIWVDYLNMARKIGIDLSNKERLYPNSLKKEHDIAIFAYRSVKEELDKTAFANQAEINKYYNYSYKDLFAIVPQTIEEVFTEASSQKNCLRSYVNRIKDGETVVAFVRKKDDPDNSYVTAEINNRKLIQLKGYCNSNPKDKDLMEFVNHWSKAKCFIA